MTAYRRIQDVPWFRYGLVMADPAWDHEMRSEKGKKRSPSAHYDTMPLEDIKALPVGLLCAPDAYIWLWIPGCMINVGEAVLNAWGAEFVTMGFWGKEQKHGPGKLKMGTGYVLRECGEPFLIGRVGRPETRTAPPSAFLEPRREHSRKPEKGYIHAEQMVPEHYHKLDLFSRQERKGWDCMGDEYDKFEEGNVSGQCGQADWQHRQKAEKDTDGGEVLDNRQMDLFSC